MLNPKKHFILKRKFNFADFCLVFVFVLLSYFDFLDKNSIGCAISIVIAVGLLIYLSNNNDIHIKAKATINELNLYQITDKENNNVYVLASSLEEAELLSDFDKITGDISYLGKVKYFE